jgi:hypothetical protein
MVSSNFDLGYLDEANLADPLATKSWSPRTARYFIDWVKKYEFFDTIGSEVFRHNRLRVDA